MLIPFVILPNLFNEELINSDTQVIDNLALFLKNVKNKGIILFDSDNCIDTAIYNYLAEFKNQQKRKKYQEVYKFIHKLNKFNILTEDFENDLNPVCEKIVSIMKNSSDITCICGVKDCDKDCKKCLQNALNNTDNQILEINNITDDIIDRLSRTTFTSVQEYDIDKLHNIIFKNFVKYASEISIYDNQMIPLEKRNINLNSKYQINENYEYNIEHLFRYMFSINPNLTVNLYLIIKQEQYKIRNQIIDSFNIFLQKFRDDYSNAIINTIPIIEVCNSEFETKILHQRYFISNHIIFSCDRGLDIINKKNNKVRDFNIAIVDKADAKILKYHLNNKLVIAK